MLGPLNGVRVLELAQHLAGPYCSMILADLGADVIKVEKPGGDDAREMPPFVGGESYPFMTWNRNKRSVVLDLKTASGAEACGRIAERSDVLLQNFRPGTLDRLGLGYEQLNERNPRLIYCSISGFGETGPYRDRGGFDLVVQGMSGLMAICGEVDGPPLRLPIAISDLAAGMYAAIGILAALNLRQLTGKGQAVDISLFDSAVSLGVYEAACYFATGQRPPRLGQAHRGTSPYQVFRSQDGWLTIGGGAQHLWNRICDALGLQSLKQDPRFADNAARVINNRELVELMQERLATQPTAYWLTRFGELNVPAGPVLTHDQVFADPHLRQREMIVDLPHPAAGGTRTIGTPLKLSLTPAGIRSAAPRLGEHTEEVLPELCGESEEEVVPL